MSEFLDNQPERDRIFGMVKNVNRIIRNPVVVDALEAIGSTPGVGSGLAEYRAGEGFLASDPQVEGDTPAEISFYPEVEDIDLEGAIYWHGPKSHALGRGVLMSFRFGDALDDGHYVDFLEIQLRRGQPVIGRPVPAKLLERKHDTDLWSPEEQTVILAESKLVQLLDHIETKEIEALSKQVATA